MTALTVTHDLRKVVGAMNAMAKTTKWSIAKAINDTLWDVRSKEQEAMREVFDRPTPYILGAIGYNKATAVSLSGEIGIRDELGGRHVSTLMPHIEGGGREMRASERRLGRYWVPNIGVKYDAYGNVPGSTVMKIMSQLKLAGDRYQNASDSSRSKRKRRGETYFIMPDGSGIWVRRGAKLQPALLYAAPPNYEKRFPYYEIAEAAIDDRLWPNMRLRLGQALLQVGFR